jgi:hypothetical protein
MVEASIQEMTIAPSENGGFFVQLHISDAAPDAEEAAFVLKLHVEIERPKTDQLGVVQREALIIGSQVLRDLINALP